MAEISNVSLDDLIEAIAAAVITAQDRIEKHQIKNLSNYFERDSENPELVRPISFVVALPSMTDDQSGDEIPEEKIVVPLVAVIPQNQLKIKDVKITFDAGHDQITELTETGNHQTEHDQVCSTVQG